MTGTENFSLSHLRAAGSGNAVEGRSGLHCDCHVPVILAGLDCRLISAETEMCGKGGPALESGNTVLVVEPDPDLRAAICELLEVFEYRVFSARNAETALRACAKLDNQIDVLVVAAFMPRSTGLEVIDAVRDIGCRLQALLYSPFAPDESIERRIESGEAFFLPMPFSPDDFRCKIKETVDRAELGTRNDERPTM